jgi:hypothetical protein
MTTWKCPICHKELSMYQDSYPLCSEHGRFGWFRQRLWQVWGPIRKVLMLGIHNGEQL